MYDDILPTFNALKPGNKIGLVSNAQPMGIQWHLDRSGLITYFDEVIISGAVALQKPNPVIFELAAESICSDPAECMMIGDSPPGDAQASEIAGMKGVVIDRTGAAKEAFPDLTIATDMRQILDWVG
jgi:putative hydrolase of the HAD superfamily